MKPFSLIYPRRLTEVGPAVAEAPASRAIRAGGIDLLDHLKAGLRPELEALVDLGRLDPEEAARFSTVEAHEQGLRLGAGLSLAALAEPGLYPDARRYEALRMAAAGAATPGIRNAATLGGNLLQRPRCWYYRDPELRCLKKGGQDCLALGGDHRYHAILGAGPSWAVHASSLAPALVALDARVQILDLEGGARSFPIAELFVSPSEDPTREHRLRDGELLVAVELPAPPSASAHADAREKQSHDWALAEASVALWREGERITRARLALGQVAPIPWLCAAASKSLAGARLDEATIAATARLALEPAQALAGNAYKVRVAEGVLRHALHRAAGLPLPE